MIKIDNMGPKNLTVSARFILSPRPTLRKRKWPRMKEESPNGLESSSRTSPSLANSGPRREEQHAIKGRLLEHPKRRDKYCGSALRAW